MSEAIGTTLLEKFTTTYTKYMEDSCYSMLPLNWNPQVGLEPATVETLETPRKKKRGSTSSAKHLSVPFSGYQKGDSKKD